MFWLVWYGIGLIEHKSLVMATVNNDPKDKQEQEWENPQNPESTSDARDDEQIDRQYEEAKRRKENLSETDHIDKEIKKD
jgi:hypothetical protein